MGPIIFCEVDVPKTYKQVFQMKDRTASRQCSVADLAKTNVVCPEQCDVIDKGVWCSNKCMTRVGWYDICRCQIHATVVEALCLVRISASQPGDRCKCIVPTCQIVVSDPNTSDHVCCGCCQARAERYAEDTWRDHRKWCPGGAQQIRLPHTMECDMP